MCKFSEAIEEEEKKTRKEGRRKEGRSTDEYNRVLIVARFRLGMDGVVHRWK